MAQRRMLAKQVLQSEEYIELSMEAKALYPFLMLETDDDGFIGNVKIVCRAAGLSESVVDELAEAGFVIRFGKTVCVVSHFCVQNSIQKSKKRDTSFVDELEQLVRDKQGVYHLRRTFAGQLPDEVSEEQLSEGQSEESPDKSNLIKKKAGKRAFCPICQDLVPVDDEGIGTCRKCGKLFRPHSTQIYVG